MDRKELFTALASADLEERLEALKKTSFIPEDQKSLDQMLEQTLQSQSTKLERAMFNILEDVSAKLAASGYKRFVVQAHTSALRVEAIKKLEEEKSSDVSKVVAIAMQDWHSDVVIAAINTSVDRSSPEIKRILRRLIITPTKYVDKDEHGEEIKQKAIEAIGSAKENDMIDELVEIVLHQREYAGQVGASLKRIKTSQVVKKLLDTIEPDFSVADLATPIDHDYKLFVNRIIGQISIPKAELGRYREFLFDLYDEEVRSRDVSFTDQVAAHFDEQFGSKMIQLIEEMKGSPNVTSRIFADLPVVSLQKSFHVWLQVLDMEDEGIVAQAIAALDKKLEGNLANFPDMLATALEEGDRVAFKDARMGEVIQTASPAHAVEFSSALFPLISDNPDSGSSQIASRFLKTVLSAADPSLTVALIDNLSKQFRTRKDGRQALGQLLIHKWNSVSPEQQKDIWRHLQAYRNKLSNAKSVASMDELSCFLIHTITNPGLIAGEVVGQLKHLTEKDGAWNDLQRVLECSQENIGDIVLAPIAQEWHKDLFLLAKEHEASGLGSQCRGIIQSEEYDISKQDRAVVVEVLGEEENPNDIELFGSLISSENASAVQVAAVNAIGLQRENEDIEDYLLRALKSHEAPVVQAAVSRLGDYAFPDENVISELQKRSDAAYEKNAAIRSEAEQAADKITASHLSDTIGKDTEHEEFESWLAVLRQIGQCDCAEKLEGLLAMHSDPDYYNRRESVVRTIAQCVEPDEGIRIIETFQQNERVEEVQEAMRFALGELEGHPDRETFRMLEKVTGNSYDQKGLLGGFQLDEIFAIEPQTSLQLRDLLRRAKDQKDNDVLVTQLDAMSDALIYDVFAAYRDELDPDNKIPLDEHNNRIGKIKSFNSEIYNAASFIHNLRNSKAKDVHPRDKTGSVRSGIDDGEREDAVKYFDILFREIVLVLKAAKEAP